MSSVGGEFLPYRPMGYKEAIRQIFPDAAFLEEMDARSPDARSPKRIEGNFTTIVNCLRGHPSSWLSTLGTAVWDIVDHGHVSLAMHTGVPTMSFVSVRRKDNPGNTQQGMILVPPSWLDLVLNEPAMAVGGVIFNGSQAVDYYNDRIGDGRDPGPLIKARSWNYEAEFLRTVPSSLLNSYQRGVLEMHPNGFEEKYVYEYRPVAPQVSRTACTVA